VTATNVFGLLPRKLAKSSPQLRHHATGIPFATVFWPTENASDGVCEDLCQVPTPSDIRVFKQSFAGSQDWAGRAFLCLRAVLQGQDPVGNLATGDKRLTPEVCFALYVLSWRQRAPPGINVEMPTLCPLELSGLHKDQFLRSTRW
jgi:hypothetical protein